mgnify:CR=1
MVIIYDSSTSNDGEYNCICQNCTCSECTCGQCECEEEEEMTTKEDTD